MTQERQDTTIRQIQGAFRPGDGNPEGAVTAPPGAVFGSSNGTIYVKASGTGNTGWQALGVAGAGGPPSGPAGGDLSGSFPNPQIASGVIVDGDVNAANKDGAAATPSMRTLGTGALQATAGNDARLSDARAPNGAASGDLTGSFPGPTLVTTGVTASTYGSATQVPIITVDAKGRLTLVTTATITAGSPPVPLEILAGTTYTVAANSQVLHAIEFVNNGTIVNNGQLVQMRSA